MHTVNFIYSVETEADRILQCLCQVVNRFYQKNGFLVLPYLAKGNASTVYLPEIDLGFMHDYLPSLAKLDLDIPMKVDTTVFQNMVKALKKFDPLESIVIEKLKSDWFKISDEFFELLVNVNPNLADNSISLEIRPSKFGSVSSFGYLSINNETADLRVYIRSDFSIAQIAEAILSAVIFKSFDDIYEYNWKEKETVIDFLFSSQILKSIFPDYLPTLSKLRCKEQGSMRKDSNDYLLKLGFPNNSVFSLREGKILLDNKEIDGSLSLNELTLLRFFILRNKTVCSIEEIGHILWDKEFYDKFSPWAVAKIIQRLREKLRSLGLSSATIQTLRGRGYMLSD